MATAGIVAEYNPFHWGHAWHIARTRRTLGADTAVICVMSGHWVQRGSAPSRTNGAGRPWPSPAGRIWCWSCPPPGPWPRRRLSPGGRWACWPPRGWWTCSPSAVRDGGTGAPAGGGGGSGWSGLPGAAAGRAGPWAVLPGGPAGGGGGRLPGQPKRQPGVEYLRALPPGMEALTIPRRGAATRRPGGRGLRLRLGAADPPPGRTRRRRRTPISPPPGAGRRRPWRTSTGRCWPVCARWTRWTGPPSPTAGQRRACPPGWRVLPGRRTAWRTFTPGPRPSATLTPGCGGWPWPLSWGCGRRSGPRRRPMYGCWASAAGGGELLRRMKETCALPVVVKPAQARALDGDARALFEAEARRTDLFGLCFPTARPCGLEWTRSPVVKERQG